MKNHNLGPISKERTFGIFMGLYSLKSTAFGEDLVFTPTPPGRKWIAGFGARAPEKRGNFANLSEPLLFHDFKTNNRKQFILHCSLKSRIKKGPEDLS